MNEDLNKKQAVLDSRFGIKSHEHYATLRNHVVDVMVHGNVSESLNGILHSYNLCNLLQEYEERNGITKNTVGLNLLDEMSTSGWFSNKSFYVRTRDRISRLFR